MVDAVCALILGATSFTQNLSVSSLGAGLTELNANRLEYVPIQIDALVT